MSSLISINTASLEQLKLITGISDKRAQKIIKKRQEKGSALTLEDLKLMSDVPNTMWDPLIEAGTITLEQPEDTQGTEATKGDSPEKEQIKKMAEVIDTLQKDFLLLKKEKTMMQAEFEQKIHDVNIDFKVKMKNKEFEYQKQQETIAAKHKETMEALIKETQGREEKLLQIIQERDEKLKQLQSGTGVTTNVDDK